MIVRMYLFLYSEWTHEHVQFTMMCTCFFCDWRHFYSRKYASILHFNIIYVLVEIKPNITSNFWMVKSKKAQYFSIIVKNKQF